MANYTYQNFYEIIEQNASKSPRKPVIFVDDRKVSNIRLKEKVDTFARFLEFSDIKKGDTIAMIVANSEEFVISFFAVTKIGAVAVPINTFLKSDEYEYIIKDCGAKLLISSSKHANETKNLLHSTQIEKIIWTESYDALDEHNFCFTEITGSKQTHEKLEKPPMPDDLACIIYTSGTTGKPKGAMLTYKNIYSNLIAAEKVFGVNEKDRFIVYLPMFHSFTLSIVTLLPLYVGGSIVIVKSVFPFSNVLKQILLKRVTAFLGVPTVYNALNKAKIPWYFMWFNKIRLFISGSAPLSEKVLDDFAQKFKKATLIEGYGLSECSPAVSVNRMDQQKALSVGLPLPGYEVKVVNDDMVEVSTGEIGELIVKGDCVMQGYLNRPEATDDTISNGWLKTGDLAKLDDDGFIYIVDKKDLIISKGINIYPREIEELLYQIEGVDAAAVVGIKDVDEFDENPMAFIQLKDDRPYDLTESSVKKILKKQLANFKIPKNIYFVEDLPKNATGKVLKRVLKEEIKNGKYDQD